MVFDNGKDDEKKDWPTEKLEEGDKDKEKDSEKDEWPIERLEKGGDKGKKK